MTEKQCQVCGTVWHPKWKQCEPCRMVRKRLRRWRIEGVPAKQGHSAKYDHLTDIVIESWMPRKDEEEHDKFIRRLTNR